MENKINKKKVYKEEEDIESPKEYNNWKFEKEGVLIPHLTLEAK